MTWPARNCSPSETVSDRIFPEASAEIMVSTASKEPEASESISSEAQEKDSASIQAIWIIFFFIVKIIETVFSCRLWFCYCVMQVKVELGEVTGCFEPHFPCKEC